MRRKKYPRPLKDMLLEVKLEMELEKLVQLRGVRNPDGSHVETFLHYEDLPPPPLEDRERIRVRFEKNIESLYTSHKLREAERLKLEEQLRRDPGAKIEFPAEPEQHNVNPYTHSPYTGEPYDYSEVEAQFGPYDRPDKPPITVTLRPSAKDMP